MTEAAACTQLAVKTLQPTKTNETTDETGRKKHTNETTSKACLFGVWGCFMLK